MFLGTPYVMQSNNFGSDQLPHQVPSWSVHLLYHNSTTGTWTTNYKKATDSLYT